MVQEAQLGKNCQDLTSHSVMENVTNGPHDNNSENTSSSQSASCYGGIQFPNRGGRNLSGHNYGHGPTCQLCFKYGHEAFQC